MAIGMRVWGGGSQVGWRRVVAWLPVTFLGLAIIEPMLAPGRAFYSGSAPASALLFVHGAEIFSYLILAMLLTAVTAVLIFLWRLLDGASMSRPDYLAAAVNIGLLSIFFLLTCMLAHSSLPAADEPPAESMGGHTYYLIGLSCSGGLVDCPSADFPKKRYAVVDCVTGALTCDRAFLSEPLGWGPGDPDPVRPYIPPHPELTQSPAGRLQLVNEGDILWQAY